MTPQMGIWTAEDDAAAIAAHAAILDAHTRDLAQLVKIGYYQQYDTPFFVDTSTQVLTADRLYAKPIIIPRLTTFDREAIEVTAGVAGGARLGIYEDDGTYAPGALRIDLGVVDVTAAALVFTAVVHQLPKGLYWLAVVSDVGPTLRAWITGGLGIGDTADLSYGLGMCWTAHAYAALPDPYGAPTWVAKTLAIGLRPLTLD